MGDKSYTPWITVTDAGAQDGSESKVTDLNTGQSITVENQADAVAQAIKDLGKR